MRLTDHSQNDDAGDRACTYSILTVTGIWMVNVHDPLKVYEIILYYRTYLGRYNYQRSKFDTGTVGTPN